MPAALSPPTHSPSSPLQKFLPKPYLALPFHSAYPFPLSSSSQGSKGLSPGAHANAQEAQPGRQMRGTKTRVSP